MDGKRDGTGAGHGSVKRILPPTYFLLTLLAMIALHVGIPSSRYWSFPLAFAGIVPLALGVVLNIAADREFKKHQTTVKPYEISSALITAFPFSFSRHPMYFGMVLVLIGIALLLGTAWSALPVFVFVCVVAYAFVPDEERMLAETFGDEWQAYRSQVRRWI